MDGATTWKLRPASALFVVAVGCGAPGEVPPVPVQAPLAAPEPPWGGWARRLSVRELRHALADLTGADPAAGVVFPDDSADGFDNVREAAAIQALLVERLDEAASVAAGLLVDRHLPAPTQVPPGAVEDGCAYQPEDEGPTWWVSWSPDPVPHRFTVDRPGPWLIEIPVLQRFEAGALTVWIDGRQQAVLEVAPDPSEVSVWSALGASPAFVVELAAGEHEVAWELGNPSDPDDWGLGFPPCVFAPALAARVEVSPLPAACSDIDACAGAALAAEAARAWRRPLVEADTAALADLFDAGREAGASVRDAVEGALHAALLAPSFLMVEDRLVGDARGLRLDDHAVATRLALMVWSSVPDDALRACADQGLLVGDDPSCGLDAQLGRLLADPRATRFAEGFTPRWLRLDPIARVAPEGLDAAGFAVLYGEMLDEATALVQGVLDDPTRPLDDLLDAPDAWLGDEVAAWYGADGGGVIDVGALGRGGVAGLGAVLVSTSPTGRASPVRRGAWVRDVLLCDPPDPPPPGVPALDPSGSVLPDALDALAAHSADPACASCHASIDPIGIALLGFDAWGRRRERPVPAQALPDGVLLEGLHDLRGWAHGRGFRRCAASAVATYALGRRVDPREDAELLDRLLGGAPDASLHGLLSSIVHSDAFLRRAGP